MSDRKRTPRNPARRARVRRHHADRTFRATALFDLSAEDLMHDLAPGWRQGTPTQQDAS